MENLSSVAPLIEVRGLCHSYPNGKNALNGIDFILNKGEKVALVGANGSGKSTLLTHIAGCYVPQRGEILLEGRIVGTDLERLRSAVGLIFQESDDQLFMPSVLEDVAFGPVAHKISVSEAHVLALKTLESLGVVHLADRSPHRLSGGEKRMAALAGILVMSPKAVILDEPSASRDPRSRWRVIETLKSMDSAILLATHDLDMALEVCTRAIILNDGRVAAQGTLPELFKDKTLLAENALLPGS